MPNRKVRKMPKEGTVRTRTFSGRTYKLTVVKTDSGIGFQVGRDVFATPTAAAKSITKKEVNGWAFWRLDTD